ncbi:MAG: hypothetical protein QM751_13470 [Paludibacteraceae bacterium]
MIPGAYTNVYLRLNENADALMIPTQAIIPQEEKKMVIVSKNGKATFTEIKTGIRKRSHRRGNGRAAKRRYHRYKRVTLC